MPSKVIKTFSYNEERRELVITFLSGKAYVYTVVSKTVYEAMTAAFSKGQFFNDKIKSHYSFYRLS